MTWIFWALLSALFAAATALLAKVGVSGIDSNLATAIRTTVVFVFAWAVALGLQQHHALAHIERRSWIFLLLSGLCTGLSWLCYFRACSWAPPRAWRPSINSAWSLSSSLPGSFSASTSLPSRSPEAH